MVPAEETAFQRTLDELLLRLAQKGSPALWPLISLRNGATVPKKPGDWWREGGWTQCQDGGTGTFPLALMFRVDGTR